MLLTYDYRQNTLGNLGPLVENMITDPCDNSIFVDIYVGF